MEERLAIQMHQHVLLNCFLDKDLSLYKMASILKTNTSYLSRAINKVYKKRFSDFINECRIKYTIRQLKSNEEFCQYTVEHIADLSGFSSTSAFYNAFKKYTGDTPANYIKELLCPNL